MRTSIVTFLILAVLAVPNGARALGQGDSGGVPITRDNAERLAPLASLESDFQSINDVAFSSDGARLAAGGYGDCAPDAARHTCPGLVMVWDVASGDVLARLDAGSGPITSVAFNPAGDRLAALGYDSQIRVWSLPRGREMATLDNDQGIGMLAFSVDGALLASTGSEGAVHLWNLAEDAEENPLLAGYSTKISLAFSPVDSTLAMGSYQSIALWHVFSPGDNGGVINVPSANLRSGPSTDYPVQGVAFRDDVVTILDTNDAGDWYYVETADEAQVWIAAFLVDTGYDAARSPREIATLDVPFKGRIVVTDLAFSQDGTLLAGATTDLGDNTGGFAVWQMSAPEPDATPTPTPAPDEAEDDGAPELIGSAALPDHISALALNADASLIALATQPTGDDASGGTLRLWDVAAQAERAAFDTPVSAVAFSPEGTLLASARSDGALELWGVAEE